MSEPEEFEERLSFDVELERMPPWVHAASALVVLVSVLVAARVVPMLVLLPFLVVSSLGRRFASSATHLEVDQSHLELGGRTLSRSKIVDVWIDADRTEPRAVLAFAPDLALAILHFPNAEQARRFGEALAPSAGTHTFVAGHRPRLVDLLAPARFIAIAAAFVATGSGSYGLFVLAFFALGAWTLMQAKQLVTTLEGFEVRTLLGVQRYRRDDVESIDYDAGILTLRSGGEIAVGRSALRDATLATAGWLERARTRVFEAIGRAPA